MALSHCFDSRERWNSLLVLELPKLKEGTILGLYMIKTKSKCIAFRVNATIFSALPGIS